MTNGKWSYKFHEDNKEKIENHIEELSKDPDKKSVIDGFLILLQKDPDQFATYNYKGNTFLHVSDRKTKDKGLRIRIVFTYEDGEITIHDLEFE